MSVTRARTKRIKEMVVCSGVSTVQFRSMTRDVNTHTMRSTHSNLSFRALHPIFVEDPDIGRDDLSTQARVDMLRGLRLRSDSYSLGRASQSFLKQKNRREREGKTSEKKKKNEHTFSG